MEDAERDGVIVPTTLEEYCIKPKMDAPEAQLDMTGFYVDDCGLEDDDLEMSGDDYEDEDDSSNGM